MSISLTVPGTPKDSNGCATTSIPNPFNGDLYFSECPVKICGSLVIHGTIHIPAGCSVTITGDLTIVYGAETPSNEYWDVQGALVVEGMLTVRQEPSGQDN